MMGKMGKWKSGPIVWRLQGPGGKSGNSLRTIGSQGVF